MSTDKNNNITANTTYQKTDQNFNINKTKKADEKLIKNINTGETIINDLNNSNSTRYKLNDLNANPIDPSSVRSITPRVVKNTIQKGQSL